LKSQPKAALSADKFYTETTHNNKIKFRLLPKEVAMQLSKVRKIFGRLPILIMMATTLCTHSWADTVQINNFEMHYEVLGGGEPLLLLHGFNGTGATWDSLTDELEKQYQLIIPDLRGHGLSTNPSGIFTHRQSALDVFALIDHLELEQVRAMGISTGGMTLLHMATQQPDRIGSMVLIGATIYFPKQAREIMRGQDLANIPEEQMQYLRNLHPRGDEQIFSLRRQFNAFKDSYDDMNFTSPFLSTITAKTLIVHGDRDVYFPARIALEMYTGISNSYLWIVPGGGHVPIFGSIEQYFLQVASEFLSNN